MSRTDVVVRPLEPFDVDAIVAIDEKLSGQTRKDYWQREEARAWLLRETARKVFKL